MKKFLSFVIVFIFGLHLFASGQWVKIKSSTPSEPSTTLISSDISSSVIHLTVDGFWKSEVQTPRGSAWLIDLGNNVRNLEQGAPDLPYVSTSLIIPDLSKMRVEILSADFKEFHNVLVAPSKGNLYRDIDPATVPYTYGDAYLTNGNYPGDISRLTKPYIVRDYRGEALWMFPFQYNPVTKTLRVYYDIQLKVVEAGTAEVNPFSRVSPLDKIDSRFNQIYKTHFLNYRASSRDYTPVDEHGNMLIISYGDFMDEMDPFITWKTQTGTHVDIVDVATIGGAAAIKQYVADYYNDSTLTFLMLIGDAAQVPTSNAGSGDSDNDYTYVVGNDHYPDLFCGRFSAETEEQVSTQVTRIIDYEKTPSMSDTSWYTQSLGIASNQGTGDDNEYDWEHIRNIQENKLLPYTYVYDYELYDGTHGGNDAAGNPNQADVANAVNDGVTIINYCGHGSNTSWGTTGFSNFDVNNLTNADKLPFIFSVACVNGNFKNHTCFAEAWMRAEDSFGNPTGAISTIMSTINQSWDPPMCGQDAMDDILVETYANNIKRTFGGVTMNGCMEMNDTYGSGGYEMTDTWTIFGDPSLMLRTDLPLDIDVTHPDMLTIGDTMMIIGCPVEGAVATLSMNGVILGSTTISGGTATIFFNTPLNNIGDADFVVVAYNHIPYITTIPIIASGPQIEYVSNFVNDSLGNNNQLVDYTEDINLTVYLTNSGVDSTTDLIANLSSNNPYITITDTTENYGSVAPDDTVGVWNGYRFTVADSVPDMEEINFSMVAHDTSNHAWNMNFTLVAHAPQLQYAYFEIVDTTGNGNANGKLDAGETAYLNLYLINAGSADAYNVTGLLSENNDWISIENNQQSYGDIVAGDTAVATYTVTAEGDTPQGYLALFTININADYNISGRGDFSVTVGQKPILIIKLAPTLTADSLMSCLAELSIDGDTVSEIPENIDDYRVAFVLLGTFSTNHILTNAEGQQLADYLNNGGNLYMEGGDTWAVDTITPVHPMFQIEGLSDGTDDLFNISGKEGAFMQGFSFEFAGANNFIDQIAPLDKAFTILANNQAGYDVSVAYTNGSYSTIGSSFEFGGLLDNQNCNKTGYLAEMLHFFGVTFVWTGIDDVLVNNNLVKAYPNPFNGGVHFELNNADGESVTLNIYDLRGKLVHHSQANVMSSKNIQLNWHAATDGVKPGVYFYRITYGDRQATGKIVYTK